MDEPMRRKIWRPEFSSVAAAPVEQLDQVLRV